MLFNECGFDWSGTIGVEKREDEEHVKSADIFSENE